jgi:Zn-dependent protease with chaperone function
MNKLSLSLCALALLGGCATAPECGRTQLAAPAPVSAVYSEMNLQLALVTTAAGSLRCPQPGCAAPEPFEQRVAWIGPELAKAAYELFPDLSERVPGFEFAVADKAEPGTLSNSSGRIIVLRPVSALAPNDVALAYIVGRELGHVIAQHHEENTAVSLIVSGLVQLLLPAASVARLFSNAFLTGTAGTSAFAHFAAGASLTATSFFGSRLVMTSYRPVQRDEADAIARTLLAHLGFEPPAVSAAFASVNLKAPETEWLADLRASVDGLAAQHPSGKSVLVDSRGSVSLRHE